MTDIIQGKASVAEASRTFDIPPSEYEFNKPESGQ